MFTPKSSVFISYSRKDQDFVRQLSDALRDEGRSVWVDWASIEKGEQWLERIFRGIENEDAFVFVLSPDSLTSEICTLEFAHALAQNKRIVPIVRREVMADNKPLPDITKVWFGEEWAKTAETNWTALKHINWLFFRETDDFATSLQTLIDTINTDVEYVKTHTNLQVRALQWERRGHPAGFLLHEEELLEAEAWLLESATQKQTPTRLQELYIRASRENDTNIKRRTRALRQATVAFLTIGTVAVLAAILGAITAASANRDADRAVQTQNAVQAAVQTATLAQGQAELASTQITFARMDNEAVLMAIFSQQQLEQGYWRNALLLALESAKNYPIVWHYESLSALDKVLSYPVRESLYARHEAAVNGATWSQDESRILSWSEDNTVRVWDALAGEELVILQHENEVNGALWNVDETRILSWSNVTLRVWDAMTGAELLTLQHEDDVTGALWNTDGSRILSWSKDGTVRLWDSLSGAELLTLWHEDRVNGAVWNKDETRILSWSGSDFSATLGVVCVWDSTSGARLLSVSHEGGVGGAIWSADETRLLTWSGSFAVDSWKIRILDATNGTELLNITPEGSLVSYAGAEVGARWNKAETQILSWSLTGFVQVWDAATGEALLTIPTGSLVGQARWSSDERRILSETRFSVIGNLSSEEPAPGVNVWDANSGDNRYSFDRGGLANGALWDNTETYLIWWGQDGTLYGQYYNRPFEALNVIPPDGEWFTATHEGSVRGAKWNSAGDRILSWSEDGTVRVWSVATYSVYQSVDRLPNATANTTPGTIQAPQVPQWSPDGQWWVGGTLTSDQTDELITAARALVRRDFTNAERERFFLPTLAPTPTN